MSLQLVFRPLYLASLIRGAFLIPPVELNLSTTRTNYPTSKLTLHCSSYYLLITGRYTAFTSHPLYN
jgi:hypothetical protein